MPKFTTRTHRPAFQLHCGYPNLPAVIVMTNKQVRTHIGLLSEYMTKLDGMYLTAEDLKKHSRGMVKSLEEMGLIYPDEDGVRYRMQLNLNGTLIAKRAPLRQSRPPIPADVRQRVYDRDGNACLHCGTTENLSIDHIIPWSKGGPDAEENYQTLCRPCNARKGARTID